MIKKVIYPLLFILLILNLVACLLEKTPYDYKIYAIRSTYNYIYDPTRTYYINYYIDENLKDEDFTYYLLQNDKKIGLTLTSKDVIGYDEVLDKNYLIISLSFYLPEPLLSYSPTYLLLEGDTKYKLELGYFYTYYQKEYNYLNYSSLEASISKNIDKIIIKTKEEVSSFKIVPNIGINVEKTYEGYILNLAHTEYSYLYKTFIVGEIEGIEYLIDCPRFYTSSLSLNDYLNYLTEGETYA